MWKPNTAAHLTNYKRARTNSLNLALLESTDQWQFLSGPTRARVKKAPRWNLFFGDVK